MSGYFVKSNNQKYEKNIQIYLTTSHYRQNMNWGQCCSSIAILCCSSNFPQITPYKTVVISPFSRTSNRGLVFYFLQLNFYEISNRWDVMFPPFVHDIGPITCMIHEEMWIYLKMSTGNFTFSFFAISHVQYLFQIQSNNIQSSFERMTVKATRQHKTSKNMKKNKSAKLWRCVQKWV